MASVEKGAVAEIKKKAVNAIHSPCLNHLINLSVKMMSLMPEIGYYLDTVSELYNFFRYPKRNDLLQTFITNESHKQLARLCLTRWTSASNATTAVIELLPCILKALEKFSKSCDRAIKASAFELICKIDGKFIINLFIIDKILQYVMPLVNNLQKKSNTLIQSFRLIDSTIESLENLTRRIGFFENIYDTAEKLCLTLGISIIYNRNFDRKANIDHFKSIFNDNCSYFIQDLKSRTSKREESFVLLEKIYTRNAELEDLDKIALHYADLFQMNPIILTKALVSEYEVFRKLPEMESIEKTIKSCYQTLELIPKFMIILAVNPPSVASAERTFSCMKRLKTWLRTTTGQDRLQGLASMALNRNDLPNIDQIIDKFAESSRKFDFLL